MTMALAVPLLRERIGWRHWLAVLAGFIGALLIVRPGTGVFEPASAFALIGALMYALYSIATRFVSHTDSNETSLLYTALLGVVLTTRSTPGAGAGTLAVGLAIVAGFGALLTILARRNAVSAERMERTRLERVEGEMAIDWEALRETFALLVGGVRFRVDRLQYESVTPGARYAVYYYEGPEGPWLLSLEKLGDA